MSEGWTPGLAEALRAARDFVREALDAQRAGRAFSDTRTFTVGDVRASEVFTGIMEGARRRGVDAGVALFAAAPSPRAPSVFAGGPVTVSISGPFVRVKFDEASLGLGIEEAAALAGVSRPIVTVPKVPPPTVVEIVPFERQEQAFLQAAGSAGMGFER